MAEISKHWALKDRISVREAAFFICGHDPIDGGYMEQREQAEIGIVADALCDELSTALIFEDENLLKSYGMPRNSKGEYDWKVVTWDQNILHTGAKAWAERKGYSWPVELSGAESKKAFDKSKYPKELRAAIEAFEALKDSKGSNSPKQRLAEWLECHKSNYGDLSAKAIARISTVANWKSEGGTPTAGG